MVIATYKLNINLIFSKYSHFCTGQWVFDYDAYFAVKKIKQGFRNFFVLSPLGSL